MNFCERAVTIDLDRWVVEIEFRVHLPFGWELCYRLIW